MASNCDDFSGAFFKKLIVKIFIHGECSKLYIQ